VHLLFDLPACEKPPRTAETWEVSQGTPIVFRFDAFQREAEVSGNVQTAGVS